jgi:hypothetical protein
MEKQHVQREFLDTACELFVRQSYPRWQWQFRCALFCLLLAFGAGALPAQVQPGTTNKCEVMGIASQIRKLATKAVRPVYPDEAIRAGTTGLVVAEVCVPPGGRPASIKISSAPSEALARAVKTALSQWKFRKRVDEDEPLAFGGKIIFYFLKQGDKWKVLDPMESFYVGPRFALSQQHPLPKSELFSWPKGAFAKRPTGSQERKVFAALQTERPAQLTEASSSAEGVPVVKSEELHLLLKGPDTVVLDVRERSPFYEAHMPNALNMPLDEIVPRAPHELPDDREILVYVHIGQSCSGLKNPLSRSLSKGAIPVLRYAGFTKVRIIADDLATLASAGIRVEGKPCP